MTGRSTGPAAEAVLFDMDGLLVDSEPLWTVAEEELAARLGGTWTAAMKAAVVGTRMDVAVPTILRMLGRDDGAAAVRDTTAWLLARMVELFGQDLALRPGAVELLDGLSGGPAPIALVSSSFRVLVDAGLAILGPDRFVATVAGDEVVQGKPHPEPYVAAAHLLGVDPARCVVLEDSPAGVASAEAAGCVCVAVPDVTPVPRTPRRPVLGSLHDVDVAWLLGLPATLPPAPAVDLPAV